MQKSPYIHTKEVGGGRRRQRRLNIKTEIKNNKRRKIKQSSGTSLVSMRQASTPSDHQSAACPYGSPLNTSGAGDK
ncbi:hypothetical protein JYU34_005721 [Plutella xylostella]|uniref:Uncharacterized protein n=1 Tax=Plutella xylostella TaxID=51655 RepID=A0ABQ7QTY7_PLUXY|nr:hypothetical protein JYU34_005721 [Plutella xylostella]